MLGFVKKSRGVAILAISLFSVATLLTIAALAGGLPWWDRTTSTESASATPSYTPRPTRTHIVRFEKYGTAADNLEYVDYLSAALLKRNPSAGGKKFINVMVKGGFSKKAMEVTPDKTVEGYPADAIVFSIRFDGRCIVGQKGPEGYSSVVLPVLKTGRCLVGKTLPIDW